VGVPAAQVDAGDLQSQVGLDDLRHLEEALAEIRGRVLGAVVRLVLAGIRLGELGQGLEGLPALEVGEGGAVVERGERRLELGHLGRGHAVAAFQVEVDDRGERRGRHRAAERRPGGAS